MNFYPPDWSSVIRVAGRVGLLGGVSGVFTELSANNGGISFDSGVFVASFMPVFQK